MGFDHVLPQAQAAGERIVISAASHAFRQRIHVLGIASAEQNGIRLKRRSQHGDQLRYIAVPLVTTVPLEP